MDAAVSLGAASTFTAVTAARWTVRMKPRYLRKAHGVFMVGAALFMMWRQGEIKAVQAKKEGNPSSLVVASAPSVEALPLMNSANEWPRFVLLGALSGLIIGSVGVGVSWMLAPVIASMISNPMSSEQMQRSRHKALTPQGYLTAAGDLAENINASPADELSRRTAGAAMVPPSIAAAWMHYRIGNAPTPTILALPLAAGAIAGSVFGGSQLGDVTASEELRIVVSMLFFLHGCWSILKP